MNVVEELRALDASDPGRWPLPFRIAAIVIILALGSALGIWYFVVQNEIPALETSRLEEVDLRASFEQKQRRAANFDAYREQLEAIEVNFGAMLQKLPGQTEVPQLLEDIERTALGVGLDPIDFLPQDEVTRDFYAEKPVTLRYEGSYHQIGEFISEVAAMARIVTLHNIQITPLEVDGDVERLQFTATAKTYRYLDEESI